ncbi:MAG: MerR family transcriptional regulator [Christensenellales bacterium]|jgi:DNA-binding transcriptional MerR regulator
MTIKEMEKLSGMERANIRFYEREGLLAPKRMENGYRDYSQDDLQLLLRIKLLRSLHIPLEDIKALKEGSGDLSQTLEGQIKKLEQEKQDASYAQDICRAIQEDRADFSSLDAARYLKGIDSAAKNAKKTGGEYFVIQGDRLPQVFHPWRRLLARGFDIFLYRIMWTALLAFVFNVNISARSNWGNLFDSYVAWGMMLLLEPLWLSFFGTTPGKAIFGLRIESAEGKRLSYKEGLERTWMVLGSGMGYGLPIYDLVRLWKSYKLCSENETLPWDWQLSTSYTIKDIRWQRSAAYIGASAAAVLVLLMIQSAQLLPPNRGDITVSQFVENHNYYADYFGLSFGNKQLNEDGIWTEKEFDGTAYITIGRDEMPDYSFVLEDGHVKRVSFQVNIVNSDGWLGPYDSQMLLASLAFVGAQNEMGLLSRLPAQMAKQIENSRFQSFSFSWANIAVDCKTEYSGYAGINSQFLVPAENTAQNHYSLTFSMSK